MCLRSVHSLVCAAVLLFAVAACAPGQPRPAMVSMAGGTPYGYSEVDLGDDRFEVSYVMPALRTRGYDQPHQASIDAEKTLAYELALWRAAQVAIERGYEFFTVEESNRDADLSVRYDPYYPGGYWSTWPYGYRHPQTGWPYHNYGPYSYYPYRSGGYGSFERPSSSLRVTVRLVIREATPGEAGALESVAMTGPQSCSHPLCNH